MATFQIILKEQWNPFWQLHSEQTWSSFFMFVHFVYQKLPSG